MKLNKLSILIPLIVSVVGIIVLGLVYGSQSSITNTYQNNLPLIGLSDNVRYNVTKGHLWFEEFMAGDNSIHPEKDIIKPLFEASRNQLDSLLKENDQSLNQIEDAEMRMIIKKGSKGIDDLIKITIERWEYKTKTEQDTLATAAKAGDAL